MISLRLLRPEAPSLYIRDVYYQYPFENALEYKFENAQMQGRVQWPLNIRMGGLICPGGDLGSCILAWNSRKNRHNPRGRPKLTLGQEEWKNCNPSGRTHRNSQRTQAGYQTKKEEHPGSISRTEWKATWTDTLPTWSSTFSTSSASFNLVNSLSWQAEDSEEGISADNLKTSYDHCWKLKRRSSSVLLHAESTVSYLCR